MRLTRPMMTTVALALAAMSIGWTLYPDWGLLPCQPNPFCNLATGIGTLIYYRIGCDCHVTIEITDGAMPVAMRTLVDEWQAAGTHSVVWDGCDEAGMPVPDGTYRYTLVARDEVEHVLYMASGEAHVWCASSAEFLSWGSIKALYAP